MFFLGGCVEMATGLLKIERLISRYEFHTAVILVVVVNILLIEIEDAPAVFTLSDGGSGFGGVNGCGCNFHMATAAGVAIDEGDESHVLFAGHDAFVFGECAGVDSCGEFGAFGLQLGELFGDDGGFAFKVGFLGVSKLLVFLDCFLFFSDLFINRFVLLHQDELLVFDPDDIFFVTLNLVIKGLVFIVFLCQTHLIFELQDGVLLGFDIALETFTGDFYLFGFGFELFKGGEIFFKSRVDADLLFGDLFFFES